MGKDVCIVSLHGDTPSPPHSNTNGIRKVSSSFFILFLVPAHTSLLQPLSNIVTQNAYTRIKIDLNTLGQIMRLDDGRWMESNKPNRLSELIVARYAYDYGLRGTAFFLLRGPTLFSSYKFLCGAPFGMASFTKFVKVKSI